MQYLEGTGLEFNVRWRHIQQEQHSPHQSKSSFIEPSKVDEVEVLLDYDAEVGVPALAARGSYFEA